MMNITDTDIAIMLYFQYTVQPYVRCTKDHNVNREQFCVALYFSYKIQQTMNIAEH